MAGLIRVSPDALREGAERGNQISNILAETRDRMRQLSSMLNDAWDGGASVQALGAMAELIDGVGAISEASESQAHKLSAIAQAFESLDEGKPVSPFIAVLPPIPMLKGIGQIGLSFVGTLRIVPDEVREVADRIREVGDSIEDAAARQNQNLDMLQKEWEGRSCQKYIEENKDILKQMKILANGVNDFADRIRMAAARYEEIDNMF